MMEGKGRSVEEWHGLGDWICTMGSTTEKNTWRTVSVICWAIN